MPGRGRLMSGKTWGMPSKSIDLSLTPVSCPCDSRKALGGVIPTQGEPRAPDH